MVLDLVDVYQYYSSQKKLLQNSTHNLSFEVCLQFSYFVTYFLFNTNIVNMFKFVNVC
jgi:hypothetical protein